MRDDDQPSFPLALGPEPGRRGGSGTEAPSPTEQNRARKSIDYMLDLAFRYGGVSSVAGLLDQVAALRPYKPFNALLVLLQRPHASFLLPPQEWVEKFGRGIVPGEQPIVLLQPRGPVMFLFDVSQTEPLDDTEALPLDIGNPYAMTDVQDADLALHWITENAKLDGVRVSPARHRLRSAGCIGPSRNAVTQRVVAKKRPVRVELAVPVRFDTLLNNAYSPTEQLATLAHELGHLYCGHLGGTTEDWWPDRPGLGRPTQEYEAEAVARIVFRRLDPSAELPPHLDQYFSPGQPLPTGGLEQILTAAGRVIEMSQGFAPRRDRGPKPRSAHAR